MKYYISLFLIFFINLSVNSESIENIKNKIGIKREVLILNTNKINAYANFKTNKIYITKGLLEKLNAEMLALVLLHEKGHFVKQHYVKNHILYYLHTVLFSFITFPDPLEKSIKSYVSKLISRQFERESDDYSFKELKRLGYTSSVCNIFIYVLNSNFNKNSTHPRSLDRLNQCRRILSN